MERYLPIAEHGVIGDLHTVALVGTNGTIDWLCFPHFDSPSVFGSILDADRGGFFAARPRDPGWTSKQLYFPDTNVLITRFLSPDGVGEVHDFMPIHRDPRHRRRLIRRVVAVRGRVRFRAECRPAMNYGRDEHELELADRGALFRSRSLTLALSTLVPLARAGTAAVGEFELGDGESASFSLEQVEGEEIPRPLRPAEAGELFHRTVRYWRGWLAHSHYRRRWRETAQG